MSSSKIIRRATLALGVICALPSVTFAVPSLQLGITGGTYDLSTQTVVASSDQFTLNTYLVPDAITPVDGYYYISFAITPQVSTATDLGSFTIDGVEINATQDLLYGVPPLDAYTSLADPGDLATHGIYPTYYGQLEFTFSGQQTGVFNTQDNPGGDPLSNSGLGMYFEQFLVDVTNLDSNYAIHFDLYNTVTKQTCVKKKGNKCIAYANDTDIVTFAPFSHDAESGNGGGGVPPQGTPVPEPASLALLGVGLIGLGAAARKRRAV